MPRRPRRNFTAEFKTQVVLQLLSGQRSSAELCREHLLSPSLLAHWKDTVLEGLPSLFQGDAQRDHEHARIAELEQLANAADIEFDAKDNAVLLNNEDVTAAIRTPEATRRSMASGFVASRQACSLWSPGQPPPRPCYRRAAGCPTAQGRR